MCSSDLLKKALRDRPVGQRLMESEGWASNVELLGRLVPHARRTAESPLRLRPDLQLRASPSKPLKTSDRDGAPLGKRVDPGGRPSVYKTESISLFPASFHSSFGLQRRLPLPGLRELLAHGDKLCIFLGELRLATPAFAVPTSSSCRSPAAPGTPSRCFAGEAVRRCAPSKEPGGNEQSGRATRRERG